MFALKGRKQARKPRSYASPKLSATESLTGVRCRATSVAKNHIQSFIAPHLLILVSFSADIFSQLSTNLISRDKNLISQEMVSIIWALQCHHLLTSQPAFLANVKDKRSNFCHILSVSFKADWCIYPTSTWSYSSFWMCNW